MPRAVWHLVNGRPVVSVLLTLAGSGRYLARDLLADTGAGGAQVGFELLLERNDCLLCGGIPVQAVVLRSRNAKQKRDSVVFAPWKKRQRHRPVFSDGHFS